MSNMGSVVCTALLTALSGEIFYSLRRWVAGVRGTADATS